ncbi:MAG: starch-binding protein [Rikenellaceae bacterium]|nr:starch-binding protein [Rikenellaceae bacterium]
MKKLLYSIIALTGLAFASCTQEHIDVQYNPENAVAPTLGAIEGCELSDGGADIVVEYTKADFGVATANAHNLYISKSEDMADMKKAKAAFADATITLTQADLNVVALDFAEAGTEVDLYFAVVANLNTDKGAAVAGTDLMSNVVKATFKSYVADVLPTEKFEKVWVIGNYCGWDHSKTQFLFDYNATGTTFAGIVDFADAEGVSLANTGFKLTGIAGWDDSCNWGEETKATEVDEPASIQLITGGGSQDIMRYAKRFYAFEFDNTTLVLKKSWGADQIGIIGLNGNWESDIVMEYNPKWTRFYADIDVAEATEMKFRADAAWDINWGVDCAMGGDNIAVPAGQYRVYFNPVTGLIELNAKNFGTDEDTGAGTGTTPEPPTETTYGLIGSFNGWGEPDVDLVARGDGWYVVEDVVMNAAEGEENKFLIRLNDAWSNKFGFAEDNTFVTIDAKNTLTAEGKDMFIAAGTYDFYFNPEASELYVMTAGAADPTLPSDAKAVKVYADVKAAGWENCNIYGWGDLGEFAGSWSGTAMTAEGDYFVYQFDATAYGKTVSIVLNNGNGDQTVDIKDIVLNDDVVITLTDNEGGKWNYTVNGEAPVTPEPPAETTYGLIGDFNGWASDVDLVARGDGWYVTEALNIPAEGKLLIRLNDAWDEKYGNDGSKLTLGENALTYGGADMWIDAGDYDFYFNPAASKLILAVAGASDPTAGADTWSVIGDFQSGNWNSDVVFVEAGDLLVAQDVVFANANNEGLAFKVRKNYSWDTSYGVTDTTVRELGAAIVLDGGSNIFVNGEVGVAYDVYFRVSDMTIWVMADGATPAL